MNENVLARVGLALSVAAGSSACFVADSLSTPYGESSMASEALPAPEPSPEAGAPRCAPDAPFVREEVFYESAEVEVFGARLLPDESRAFATVLDPERSWRLAEITPGKPPDMEPFRLAATASAGYPTVSADGNVVFFAHYTEAVDDEPRADIFVSRRRADGAFDGASALPIATAADESTPYLTPSGDALYFARFEGGRYVIHRIALPAVALTETGALDPSSSPAGNAVNPVVTPDELTLYFASPNARGLLDIWKATRAHRGERFGDARLVAELRSPQNDAPTWVSPDGCVLYFDRWQGDASKVMRAFRF